MKITIFTDGASRGNPGKASYGFVIKDESEKVIYKEGDTLGITTNNVAEYTALLKALEYVKSNLQKVSSINVLADSKLIVEQMSGRFQIKSPHLKPIFTSIQFLVMELGGVSFKHIPREKNTEADRMANIALDTNSKAF